MTQRYEEPGHFRIDLLPPETFQSLETGVDPYTSAATGAKLAKLVYQLNKSPPGERAASLQSKIQEDPTLPKLIVLDVTDRFAFVASLTTPHLVTWTVSRGTACAYDVWLDIKYLLTGTPELNPHVKDLIDFHDTNCSKTAHNTDTSSGYTIQPGRGWDTSVRGLQDLGTTTDVAEAFEKCNSLPKCIGFQGSNDKFVLIPHGRNYSEKNVISYTKPTGFVRLAAGHSKGGAEVVELGLARPTVSVHAFNDGGIHNFKDLLLKTGDNIISHKICGDFISNMRFAVGKEKFYSRRAKTKHPHDMANFVPMQSSENSTQIGSTVAVQRFLGTTSITTLRSLTGRPKLASVHRYSGILFTCVGVSDNQHESEYQIVTLSPHMLVAVGVFLGSIDDDQTTYREKVQRAMYAGLRSWLEELHPFIFIILKVIESARNGTSLPCAMADAVGDLMVCAAQKTGTSGPVMAAITILCSVAKSLVRNWEPRSLRSHLHHAAVSLKKSGSFHIGSVIGSSIGGAIGSLFSFPYLSRSTADVEFIKSTSHWASSIVGTVAGSTYGSAKAPEWVVYPYLTLLAMSLRNHGSHKTLY
eukprot:TRINITY_DN16464_c0_g1_i1.p1 TRINITY_DN16464_c0_g1~~TRINITY_DN16464_c0_g1_i1.p1  ORF type:complete len:601 (+),score=88.41 TRINITY_DN16464_c0_g1_i1:52-1803(+)